MVGATAEKSPAEFVVDHTRVRLGEGGGVFRLQRPLWKAGISFGWAGPKYGGECILTADLDMAELARAKFDFDVVGHYARPDVFHLRSIK